MTLLLDTHCFSWWFTNDSRLGERARDLVTDIDNDIYLSAASSWEIAIKVSLGKLTLPVSADGLSIEHVHALRVASLPQHHRDPIDRLIVAQAQVENLPVLTVDENSAAYDVAAVWAGRGEAPWGTRSEL